MGRVNFGRNRKFFPKTGLWALASPTGALWMWEILKIKSLFQHLTFILKNYKNMIYF
jgi:hypothetical protein